MRDRHLQQPCDRIEDRALCEELFCFPPRFAPGRLRSLDVGRTSETLELPSPGAACLLSATSAMIPRFGRTAHEPKILSLQHRPRDRRHCFFHASYQGGRKLVLFERHRDRASSARGESFSRRRRRGLPRAHRQARALGARLGFRRSRGSTRGRAEARAGSARRPVSWSAPRRSRRDQGHHRGRGDGHDQWVGGARARTPGEGRHLCRKAPSRGRGHPRKDRHDPVRVRRSGANAKSMESRAHAGRLVERLRRGRRIGHDASRPRDANGRIRSPAGRLLRHRRSQADARADQPRRRHASRVEPRSPRRLRENRPKTPRSRSECWRGTTRRTCSRRRSRLPTTRRAFGARGRRGLGFPRSSSPTRSARK